MAEEAGFEPASACARILSKHVEWTTIRLLRAKRGGAGEQSCLQDFHPTPPNYV